MNLTLKIINGNRTSFHPVGSSPSVYRQPEDADGRVAKVYDTREENMHEIFKGDEAYLINGYGKTIDIVYRPDHFGAARGSNWSDEAIANLIKDISLTRITTPKIGVVFKFPTSDTREMKDQQIIDSVNSVLNKSGVDVFKCDDGGAFINEAWISPGDITKAKTPGGIFHALMKRWESGER